jgi:hypothetical protein
VLSGLLYAGVLAYACTRKPELAVFIALVGAIGGAMLAWALVQAQNELLPWALLCVGVAYAVGVIARGSKLDEAAPLVGAAMLLCAELATWSTAERYAIAAERAVVVVRARAVGGLVVAGLAAGALVVGLAAAPGGGGFGWTLLGAAAAVLAVGVAARLARP